ncbi:MAG: hypothetical protein WB975_11105 [Nitrososphaeraceae archaeon]
MLKFLNKIDLRKGPLERTVTTIIRLKAPDWNTKKHERKEFVYYFEDWTGKDWLGIAINPFSEHIEGKFIEPTYRPKLDERSGEHVENVLTGNREVYYIPFSEKNVDEIKANSAHTDKHSIRYVVKWGHEDSIDSIAQSMRNQFSYDMFLWEWEKLREWPYWPIDDLTMRPKANKSPTNLQFKPREICFNILSNVWRVVFLV